MRNFSGKFHDEVLQGDPRQSFPPLKLAIFNLNFWPIMVHWKPSFRYVPSTFFANLIRQDYHVIELGRSSVFKFCFDPFLGGGKEKEEEEEEEEEEWRLGHMQGGAGA